MLIDNAVSKRLSGLLLCLLAASVPEAHLKSQSLSPGNTAKLSSTPDAFLEERPFLQIPGPNPLVVRGGNGAWDEDVIEACDVLKDFETYYFYYHGVPKDQKKWGVLGYRIGLATASRPLGPWVKYGDQPVLDLGPKGSWEDKHVASAVALREKPGKFVMGLNYDTSDLLAFSNNLVPCGVGRKTVFLEPGVRSIMVIAENTHKSAALINYEVVTTLYR
jgi:hypothetical protein